MSITRTKDLIQYVVGTLDTAQMAPEESNNILLCLKLRMELLDSMLDCFPSWDADKVVAAVIGKEEPKDAE